MWPCILIRKIECILLWWQAVELEWGLPETTKQIDRIGPYDLVIAADCMYVDQVRAAPPRENHC